MKISVIIPVFNEIKTIEQIINLVLEQKKFNLEIIIVDDCSNDGSRKILEKFKKHQNIKIIFHEKNKGKGGAIKSAAKHISGEIVIIQDADLEYDPRDYEVLVGPIIKNETNVVYGSRVLGRTKKNFSLNEKFRIFANFLLTMISNIFNSNKLTDAHTCYKVFKTHIFLNLNLKENDFAFCPEVTTKLSKMREKITEVPISYNGREYEDGKKIKFFDAIRALIVIIKYRFFND
tara:strand:- start:47 stop:745 length:699 start_codon:yes stop_codon:yes gene_type:complete